MSGSQSSSMTKFAGGPAESRDGRSTSESDAPRSTAEVASLEIESILAAAETAAEQLRGDALAEGREEGERAAEEGRAEGRQAAAAGHEEGRRAAAEGRAMLARSREEAERLTHSAREEADRLASSTREEAEEVRAQAEALRTQSREQADRTLAASERDAAEVSARAREEAETRVRAAQEAADEVLAQAKAIGSGLRDLSASLADRAERLLADAHTGHRRMSAALGGPSSGVRGPDRERPERERAPQSERRDRDATRPRGRTDVEVPSWVNRRS